MPVMRGPDANAKSYTIKCPFCATFKITLTRRSDTGFASAFGLSEPEWVYADGSGNWKELFGNHIRAHNPAEILSKHFALEDRAVDAKSEVAYLKIAIAKVREELNLRTDPIVMKRRLHRDFSDLFKWDEDDD